MNLENKIEMLKKCDTAAFDVITKFHILEKYLHNLFSYYEFNCFFHDEMEDIYINVMSVETTLYGFIQEYTNKLKKEGE